MQMKDDQNIQKNASIGDKSNGSDSIIYKTPSKSFGRYS